MFVLQVHVGNTGCTDVQSPQRRDYSYMSTQHPGPGSLPDYQTHIDPYRLLEDDLKDVYRDIRQVSFYGLNTTYRLLVNKDVYFII